MMVRAVGLVPANGAPKTPEGLYFNNLWRIAVGILRAVDLYADVLTGLFPPTKPVTANGPPLPRVGRFF